MNKLKPRCITKCDSCFFYFTNGCIAPPGENFYIEINEKQAKLIMNNLNRFNIPPQNSKELKKRFPAIV